MRTGRSVIGWVALVVSLCAGDARAALITWEFEAVSRNVVAPGPWGQVPLIYLFSPGVPFRGRMTFDTEAPEVPPSSTTFNRYPGAVTSVSLSALFPGISGLPYGFYPLAEASFDPAASVLLVLDPPSFPALSDTVLLEAHGQIGYGMGIQVVQLNLAGVGLGQAGHPPLVPPALADLLPFALRPAGPPAQPFFSQSTGLYLTGKNLFSGEDEWVDLELTSLRAVHEHESVSLVALLALGLARVTRPRGAAS